MSDSSFNDTINGIKDTLHKSTSYERNWWNNAGEEVRTNILNQTADFIKASEFAYQQDSTAKFNQLISTNYDSLPNSVKSSITEALIGEGELPDPSDYVGIGQAFEVDGEVNMECDRCDETFTSMEDFNTHKNIDHGDTPEDNFEAEESFMSLMNPDINRHALREARKIVTEEDQGVLSRSVYFNGKDIPQPTIEEPDDVKGTKGYNDNPNEGLYDTKLFKVGTSQDRHDGSVTESYSTEGLDSWWDSLSGNKREQIFNDWGQGNLPNPDSEQSWATYNYGDIGWSQTPQQFKNWMQTNSYQYGGESNANEYQDTPEDRARNAWDDPSQSIDDKKKAGKLMGGDEDLAYSSFYQLPTNMRSDMISNHAYTGETIANEYDEKCDKCGATFDNPADAGSHAVKHDNEEVGEADNYPQKKGDNNWDETLAGLKDEYETHEADATYDDIDTKMIPTPSATDEPISSLEGICFAQEKIDYVYPTKATESTKSYTTENDVLNDYSDGDIENEEEIVEAQITERKMAGYGAEAIARELVIQYGITMDEAINRAYSVEVSINDRTSNTIFGKRYNECTEAEKKELELYSGSDGQ